MTAAVFPEDGQDLSDAQKYETYQRNKELHFLQMRNNMRNSFMNHSKSKKTDSLAQRSKSGLLGPHCKADDSNPSSKSKALHYSRSRDAIGGQQARAKGGQADKAQDLLDFAKHEPFQSAGRFGNLKMTFNEHLQMEEAGVGDR